MSAPEEPLPHDSTANQGVAGENRRKHKAFIILLCIIILATGAGFNIFINSKRHLMTDNAFIEARTMAVSSKVPGTVSRVLAHDNQLVRQGDLLLEIEPSDYQIQVAKAQASVGVAENESGGEHLKAGEALAALQSAKARHEQSTLDLQRGEKLYSREVISREQLDRLRTAGRITEAQLREAEESLKRARIEAGLDKGMSSKAKVMERKAQLDEARQLLSYTRIYAARDGYITRKSVEPGANIQAGQPLMALVPLKDAWITANYKERQIAHIRSGQKVTFRVDAYPGLTFSGRVDSIMAGTGAAFSLLPPENATGNYVKIVQRIPVKISIDSSSDPERLLRVGMSVVPTVITGRTAGDVLKDLMPFK